MAIQEIGFKGEVVSGVALRTLDQIKDAKRTYRKAHREGPHAHSIRFITSNYDELFRIPDGGNVKIDYPGRSFVPPCEYIDDYHTRIGGEVYHIYINKELQRVDKSALDALEKKDVLRVFPDMKENNKTVLILKKPKTTSSIRKVFLPRTVAEMLVKWKLDQDFTKESVGKEYFDLENAGNKRQPYSNCN